MIKEDLVLIAEIGATNARIDLVKNKQSLSKQINYLLKDFDSIDSLFKEYIKETGLVAKKGVIGVAAPILEDEVKFVNAELTFSQKKLRKKFFKEGLILVNDLELQAYAVESLLEKDVLPIGKKKNQLQGTKILVSPGTGLGLAGIVDGHINSTEAGHLHVPANLFQFSSIIKSFQAENNRMPTFEDFLCGEGLNYIYCSLSSCNSSKYSNKEILLNSKDPHCLKTKELLLHLLAIFLRYTTLIWGATGGVYISGSIANSLFIDINQEDFRKDYENSDTMRPLLFHTPIFLVLEKELGLIGATKLA